MPLGASIVYGQGSSSGNGFRSTLLSTLLTRSPNITFTGTIPHGNMSNNLCEAYPGKTISEVAALSLQDVSNLQPDWILVHLGTNDCVQGSEPAAAVERLKDFLGELRKHAPRAGVLVSTLVVNLRVGVCVDQFNGELKGIGMEGVEVVDMCRVRKEDIGRDGTHPTDGGYETMAGVWAEALGDRLGRRRVEWVG
ncbi:carbohydrate esterase family 3 protein [Piedraia hortae CBS 480.64]|uniref:Carbohydrate esterase family 3 protein n=1 Tax=Piedraia hortae CBS 480.64 TaxID=1314780 RepID=A0A6A7C803_9PEZI|nr:carbohydrate esterase family 3 protein [Piedraia hortae CBS 480.64]